MGEISIETLRNAAAQLRIDSVRSTSEAGSGHPTTCLSAAEIVATLFFGEMRYDPKAPQNPDNDRFVLSKGHAAPILYAAWAEAGLFPREELLKLRRIESDLEGHPTPRLPFVDVATGSLGQGICAAIGTALNARRIGSDYRTYVLLGDGEMAEGSVWEAANVAVYQELDTICGVIDVNGLGQSQPTQFQFEMEEIAARWKAFGWHTMVIDGHDIPSLQASFAEARATKGQPSMVLARTLKGKGLCGHRGQGGLARQGAEEGKGDRRRHRGARETAGPSRSCNRDPGARGKVSRARVRRLRQDAGAGLQARGARRDTRGLGHGARGSRRGR